MSKLAIGNIKLNEKTSRPACKIKIKAADD